MLKQTDDINFSSDFLLDTFSEKGPSYEQFLPFTELAVKLANNAIERDLGRIDMYTASEFLSKREVSPEVMITALVYVSRYKRRKDSGEFQPLMKSSFTSADLFLVSMMLASKYLFDDGIEENVINEEWADDFGIETEEINNLEIDFLQNIDWRLFVSPEEYTAVRAAIGRSVIRKQLLIRGGGSTYGELASLSCGCGPQVEEVLAVVAKVMIGCTAVYAGLLLGMHLTPLPPSVPLAPPANSSATPVGPPPLSRPINNDSPLAATSWRLLSLEGVKVHRLAV